MKRRDFLIRIGLAPAAAIALRILPEIDDPEPEQVIDNSDEVSKMILYEDNTIYIRGEFTTTREGSVDRVAQFGMEYGNK